MDNKMGVGIPDPSLGHYWFLSGRNRKARFRQRLLWMSVAVLAFVLIVQSPASAEPVPEESGFFVEEVFGDFEAESPITAVRFAPDGRAFVTERRGRILVFDNINDDTPDVIDLTPQVHGFWDRGLLGLAVDPNFPDEPWIYTFYTHDTRGWGGPGLDDDCPTPPGSTDDGCVVPGRLTRMSIDENNAAGAEVPLLEGEWCFQFPSHSADDLVFGDDGMLYLSAGDGASFGSVDYGQFGGSDGSPVLQNPCQDPPYPAPPTPETGEGGMLRSQDVRTSGDPLGYNGSILRIHPDTGYAAAGNPLYDDSRVPDQQPDVARLIAHGLRNPYRMAFGPDGDLFIGDVGWSIWEEINRIEGATGGTDELLNFGWPCYEGREDELHDFQNVIDNDLCNSLYADEALDPATVSEPLFEYRHGHTVWPGAAGGNQGGSAVSAIAFMGDSYPSEWQDALVFADYNRKGVWALKRVGGEYVEVQGVGGTPDEPADGTYLLSDSGLVDIQRGPGGDLYLVQLGQDEPAKIFRLRYSDGNMPPRAVITADQVEGPVPLTVTLDGSASENDDEIVEFEWDLDGDGSFGGPNDQNGVNVTDQFSGATKVTLRVTDSEGLEDTDDIMILPPNPTIVKPTGATLWRVGDTIDLEGQPKDGMEPIRWQWEIGIQHCHHDEDCHLHPITGFSEDNAEFVAPDHGYPSHLQVKLTATYPGNVKGESSVQVHPRTSVIWIRSADALPVPVSIGGTSRNTPMNLEAIQNGRATLSVPEQFQHGGRTWMFDEWSDGGARTRDITVPRSDLTLTAKYNGGRPPMIASIGNTTVEEGTTFQKAVTASDPDGDDIILALTKAPAGATMNPNTGVIRWTPGGADVGKTFQFQVRATDDWETSRSDTENFMVTVVAQPAPPTQPPSTEPPSTEPPTTEPPTPPDGATFADTAGSVHEHDIELLASSGITFGCNPPENTLFCPEDAVTRAQMASFLVRGLELDPADGGRFSDVTGSVHEADIRALAAAQITLGCNPPENDLYCPDDVVTRAQMASFLVRGLELAAADGGRFSDVAGSVHEADINALAEAGITLGCNPPENDLYCPKEEVTRAQMASFLVRGIPLPRP